MPSPILETVEKTHTFKAAWRVILPFWVSEKKWKAYALLAVDVAAALLATVVSVGFTTWLGKSTDALTRYDAAGYWRLIPEFCLIFAAFIACGLTELLARSALQIMWRTWLTERFLGRWLVRDTMYRIEREHLVDNPDQRIAEDINLLITNTFILTVDLVITLGRLGAFSAMLWKLSGALTFTLAGVPVTIPGYMFWLAVIYAIVTTAATHYIARSMMRLTYNQQRAEAGFRFMMVGVREHAEQIALYDGVRTERHRMRDGFEAVRQNFWQLIFVNLRLTAAKTGWGLLTQITPAVFAAPRYFARAITLGDVTQISRSFEMVSSAMSWVVTHYETLQLFRVVAARLHGLELATALPGPLPGGVNYATQDAAPGLSVTDLALRTPQGVLLNQPIGLSVLPGQRWLVKGESGAGKSTLMRALAGIWPYGTGGIHMPATARILFLSQKNYLPPGTLKAALCYPSDETVFTEAACRQVLHDCRLPHLVERLMEDDRWGMRLSPGEQQRMALARAILQRPDFLFMDESTSALDPATERTVYQTLLRQLPTTAIVHVSHRPSLDEFHQHVLQVRSAIASDLAA